MCKTITFYNFHNLINYYVLSKLYVVGRDNELHEVRGVWKMAGAGHTPTGASPLHEVSPVLGL